LAPKIGGKFENGSDGERDSFVVSTSTVAIETLPSLVRIPDNELNCFGMGRSKKAKKSADFNSELSSQKEKTNK
jgi:hypothetical protein